MDIKNLEVGQDLGYYLAFFSKYGVRMCKGRIFTHVMARKIYDEVSDYLTDDKLSIVKESLTNLSTDGNDWTSRGKLVAYLTWQKENNPNISKENFASTTYYACLNNKKLVKMLTSVCK